MADSIILDEKQQTDCILPRVVYIRATMQGLECPMLPFAVLKSDPVLKAQQYLREHAEYAARATQARGASLVYDAWKSLFADLRPDQFHFIWAWSSVSNISPRVLRISGLTFAIATCGPLHRRWLTTCPVWHNEELVAWCQVIDMHDSIFNPVIRLSEANMIRLLPTFSLHESKVA